MKKYTLFLTLLCICVTTMAEPIFKGATLSGKITDAVDGSPLIGVSVYVPELKEGTTTDVNGDYHLEGLPAKTIVLQVSYIGHQTIIQNIDLTNTQHQNFVMKESNATINEVVVTGLTGSAMLKNSPSPVSVVTSRALLSQSSANIIDAIARQPGVSQVTTGSGISKPVIRGLGYNRIVVVNDGVRQEGQQWGDEHGIEIDAQTVNSVEILKGPASLIYGSDAMAGVLIFHSAPLLSKGAMKAEASTEYQTNNGLFAYSLDMAGNRGGVVWNVRYSDKMAHDYKNAYDGYVFNSRYREQALSGLVGINRSWGYSHLLLGYYHIMPGIIEGERDEATGEFIKPVIVNGIADEAIVTAADGKRYGHAMPYQQVYHYKAVWDNSIQLGNGMMKALVGYQRNERKEFEDILNPSECGLNFMLHTLNYDFHYNVPLLNDWKTTIGINGMYQRSLNKGEEFLIPAYNLFDFGLFATASKTIDKLNLSGGLRFDTRHVHSESLIDDGNERFSDFSRRFNGVTGSIGAVYNMNDNLDLRLNLSRGFRAPNMSELASNGVHEGTIRYELGNSQLKPEYSWQLDFGIDYSSAIVSSRLALFANRINNFIFSHKLTDNSGNEVITDGQPTFKFSAGDARILGGEFSIDIHPTERLHIENSFSYVNSVQLNQPKETKYLPFTPAPRLSSELKYDIVRDGSVFDNTYVMANVECNLRQNHYFSAYDTETATPSYTLLNISAGTDIKSHGRRLLSLFITCNNLTNRAYQSHLSRLKYASVNNATGRTGVFNMGRSFGVKVQVPIDL